nr:site-specific integrase [Dyella sp. ASV21]
MIRLKDGGKVVHTESETFGQKSLAKEWMRRREAELDSSRARGELVGTRYTLGQLIDWYRKEVGKTANWGRTKEADLLRMRGYAIAARPAAALSVADYLAHAQLRTEEGAGTATIGNDLIWIGQVLKSARPSLGVSANLQALMDARHELRARRLLTKPRYRDRRLTPAEEDLLLAHFGNRDARAEIPMVDVIRFALASARRQDEITRIKWADLDRAAGVAWLDDVKHPRQKKGNRRCFRLLSDAWAIIDAQPESRDYVFPYNPRSIGSGFTRACRLLGIEDLHFHDLRHEATSRLFERGYSIQEVAQFTLHDSWATLKRYTHLRPEHVQERPAPGATAVDQSAAACAA